MDVECAGFLWPFSVITSFPSSTGYRAPVAIKLFLLQCISNAAISASPLVGCMSCPPGFEIRIGTTI